MAAMLWSACSGTAGGGGKTTRLGLPEGATTTTTLPPPPPPESLTRTWIYLEGRWMPRLPEGEIQDDVWQGAEAALQAQNPATEQPEATHPAASSSSTAATPQGATTATEARTPWTLRFPQPYDPDTLRPRHRPVAPRRTRGSGGTNSWPPRKRHAAATAGSMGPMAPRRRTHSSGRPANTASRRKHSPATDTAATTQRATASTAAAAGSAEQPQTREQPQPPPTPPRTQAGRALPTPPADAGALRGAAATNTNAPRHNMRSSGSGERSATPDAGATTGNGTRAAEATSMQMAATNRRASKHAWTEGQNDTDNAAAASNGRRAYKPTSAGGHPCGYCPATTGRRSRRAHGAARSSDTATAGPQRHPEGPSRHQPTR